MLSKGVCRRCIDDASNWDLDNLGGWNFLAESEWVSWRQVVCPWAVVRVSGNWSPGTSRRVKTDERAPRWCPYVLEHVVEACECAE